MAWIDLSSAFGYGTKLTSANMQQLRDNLTALANGDSGAPEIQTAAIGDDQVTTAKVNDGAITGPKMYDNAGEVDQINPGAAQSYYRVMDATGSRQRCCPNFDDGSP